MKARFIAWVIMLLLGPAILLADTQITSNSNLQLFPKVVQASGGNFLYSWCDNRPSTDHEFEIYSTATNSNMSKGSYTDHELSEPSDSRAGHRLHAEIVQSNNGAIVAWIDHNKQKVYATRITNSGTKDEFFGTVEVHDAMFLTPPEMCSDGAGGAIFTWIERHYNSVTKVYTDSLWIKKITSSGATDWSKTLIGSTPGSIYMPRICADDNNGARVACVVAGAYDDGYWPTRAIKVYEITSSGSSSCLEQMRIGATSTYCSDWMYQCHSLDIAYGTKTFVTWLYRRINSYGPPKNRGTINHEYVYVQAVDDNGNTTSRVGLAYVFYANHDDDNYMNQLENKQIYSALEFPRVAIVNSNNAYVVWARREDPNGNLSALYNRRDVFVQKVDEDCVPSWTKKKLSGSSPYMQNRSPQVVVDGSGNALVAWRGADLYENFSSIRACYVTPAGSVGSEVGISSGYASSFQALAAGTKTILCVWNQKSGDDWNIHADKVNLD